MSDSMPVLLSATTPQNSQNGQPGEATADGGQETVNLFSGLLNGFLLDPGLFSTQAGGRTEGDESETLSLAGDPADGKSLPPGAAPIAWGMLMIWNEAEPPGNNQGTVPAGVTAVTNIPSDKGPQAISPVYQQMLAASARGSSDGNGSGLPDIGKAFTLQLENQFAEQPAVSLNHEPITQTAATTHPVALQPTANLVANTHMRNEIATSSIPVPPQHDAWGQALGDRLQWMVGQNLQQAEIRLDPPELGALEIKIVMHKDAAQINFVTHHHQVKDAVEAATPRLREMFSDMGLSLGDVNVSQESFTQQQMADNHAGMFRDRIEEVAQEEGEGTSGAIRQTEPIHTGSGLLDIYA